ncbi:GNAT family N-acetyltransferase [Defluviimonas sp. WL0002]|uniref:GNAT family N-acetyltransferase n=2 Tax=Albidovulum marisflavi TaxID=2984159 RepID=A0ABT2Z9L9_9RHOB|nr:GNAT family N-acetyltransferase [Defluviimonas sp. WL0002]MCV2867786.1 GNAT family N-acetyltransferase [Defluviimonas sp. WL0002]
MLANTPVLETERLTLRAPAPGDWAAFDAFLSSPRAGFVRSGDYALGQTWRAFGHLIGHWVLRGFGMFVFTPKGENRALGMAGPWFPADWPEREIGWSVWTAEAEGKGYAHEAAAAARTHAFDTLGWDTAVSYVAPANARSIALAERLGALRDDAARHPAGDKPCLVYRHPKGVRA